jgi:hypothetical protein
MGAMRAHTLPLSSHMRTNFQAETATMIQDNKECIHCSMPAAVQFCSKCTIKYIRCHDRNSHVHTGTAAQQLLSRLCSIRPPRVLQMPDVRPIRHA